MYFHRKLQKSSKLSRKSLCKLKFRSLMSGNLKISVRVMYTTRQKTSTFTMRPQSCPTLHDPMDCSPPSFSVHGIFQARILEWVAISKSKGSSWHRDWSCVSCVSNWQVGSSPLTLPKSEVAQSCPTLWDPLDCSLPGSSVHGISHDKSTGVGCHFLLRGIFPTRGLDLGLLHCRSPSESPGKPLTICSLWPKRSPKEDECWRSPVPLLSNNMTVAYFREETMLLFLKLLIYSDIITVCGCAKSLQLCPTLCRPMDCSLSSSTHCPWDSPGKDAGSRLPCPSPGKFFDPAIESTSSVALALWQILYCWATREVHYGFFQCMDNLKFTVREQNVFLCKLK